MTRHDACSKFGSLAVVTHCLFLDQVLGIIPERQPPAPWWRRRRAYSSWRPTRVYQHATAMNSSPASQLLRTCYNKTRGGDVLIPNNYYPGTTEPLPAASASVMKPLPPLLLYGTLRFYRYHFRGVPAFQCLSFPSSFPYCIDILLALFFGIRSRTSSPASLLRKAAALPP